MDDVNIDAKIAELRSSARAAKQAYEVAQKKLNNLERCVLVFCDDESVVFCDAESMSIARKIKSEIDSATREHHPEVTECKCYWSTCASPDRVRLMLEAQNKRGAKYTITVDLPPLKEAGSDVIEHVLAEARIFLDVCAYGMIITIGR